MPSSTEQNIRRRLADKGLSLEQLAALYDWNIRRIYDEVLQETGLVVSERSIRRWLTR